MTLEALISLWSTIIVRMTLVLGVSGLAVLLTVRLWPTLSHTWRHRLWLAVSLQGLLWCSVPITLPAEALTDAAALHADAGVPAPAVARNREDVSMRVVSLGQEWLLGLSASGAADRGQRGQDVSDALLRTVLFCCWLVGVVSLGTGALVWQGIFAARLRRSSVLASESILAACARQAQRLGLRRPAPVRTSAALDVPLVLGIVRPTIYLPQTLAADFESNSARQREIEAILAHELAHLRRHDPLTALLALVAAILNFFHPLAWLARRELAIAREQCVDAAVLTAGHSPGVYARALLHVAEGLVSPRSLPAAGLALAPGAPLRERIADILQSAPHRSPHRAPQTPAWAVAILLGAIGLGSLVSFRPAAAADQEAGLAGEIDRLEAPAYTARMAGLKFLAASQEEDGTFKDNLGSSVGAVALAGLAFLSAETRPGVNPYSQQIDRCRDFILKAAKPSGFLAGEPNGKPGSMYDHGFATQFLARLMRLEKQRPVVKEKFQKGVDLILAAQGADGGWRYAPAPQAGGDVTVSACQLAALVAAREAGAEIPGEAWDKAVGFIQACQHPDGGFEYVPQAGSTGFARSAAAASTLRLAGQNSPEFRRLYLEKTQPKGDAEWTSFQLYGLYYAAPFFAREPGEAGRTWHASVTQALRAKQAANGSWMETASPLLGTSLAVLALDARPAPPAAPKK